MQSVHAELHPAFSWDCDDCGRENFVRCVAVEPESEDTIAGDVVEDFVAPASADISEDQDGSLFEYVIGRITVAPKMVTCGHCQKTFPACVPYEGPLDEDSDEDGDDEE